MPRDPLLAWPWYSPPWSRWEVRHTWRRDVGLKHTAGLTRHGERRREGQIGIVEIEVEVKKKRPPKKTLSPKYWVFFPTVFHHHCPSIINS